MHETIARRPGPAAASAAAWAWAPAWGGSTTTASKGTELGAGKRRDLEIAHFGGDARREAGVARGAAKRPEHRRLGLDRVDRAATGRERQGEGAAAREQIGDVAGAADRLADRTPDHDLGGGGRLEERPRGGATRT